MTLLPVEDVRSLACRLLIASGAPAEAADVVSEHLVASDLAGYPSHGLALLEHYIADITANRIDPTRGLEVQRRHQACFLADGGHGLGPYVAQQAIAEAIAVAEEHGVCFAAVDRLAHVGRLAPFVSAAAGQGFLAVMTVGTVGDPTDAAVSPAGGSGRWLGTNPIAFAVPCDPFPVVCDLATSSATVYAVLQAAQRRVSLDALDILGPDGTPTSDPQEFLAGGSLLPIAGHKGFGLGLLAALLGGVACSSPSPGAVGGCGILVISVEHLRPVADAKAAVGDTMNRLRESSQSAPVGIPGDGSRERTDQNRRQGVFVDDHTRQALIATAKRFRAQVPAALA